MFEKLANIFRIPDLRKRVLFTLAMLAVYRLGGHLPTPGVNFLKLEQYFNQNAGSFLGFVDLFSGGSLRRLTIFALGIMPYITASIILQLLTVPSCSLNHLTIAMRCLAIVAAFATAATAATIDVIVGMGGGLNFTPPAISALVGDKIQFTFVAKNHTVNSRHSQRHALT